MILIKNEGCYSSTITVDGIQLQNSNQQEVRDKLLNFFKEADLENIVNLLIDNYGSLDLDDQACEQCGNLGSTTTLEL